MWISISDCLTCSHVGYEKSSKQVSPAVLTKWAPHGLQLIPLSCHHPRHQGTVCMGIYEKDTHKKEFYSLYDKLNITHVVIKNVISTERISALVCCMEDPFYWVNQLCRKMFL